MSSQAGITRRQSTGLGRSGPRSKSGCQTCRTRRVRCDEKRPICGHCDRLKLECDYPPPQRRRRHQPRSSVAQSIGRGSPMSPDSLVQGRTMWQDGGMSASNASEPPSGDNDGLCTVDQEVITPSGNSGLHPVLAEARQDAGSSFEDTARQATAQFVLDDISCVPPDGTVLNAETRGVAEFGQTRYERTIPWHAGALNDYLPFPELSFPFTSLGFTNSINVFEPDQSTGVAIRGSAQGPQTWRSDISDMSLFASDQHALPALGGRGDGSLAPLPGSSHSIRVPSRPAFVISPSLLSPAQEEMLLAFFERDIRPPASLVGVDPLGWIKIKRYVLRMAKSHNEFVRHAIFALSTLLSASSLRLRLGTNRDDHRLFASRLQEAACAAIEVGLTHEDWTTRSSHALLVSVFLLAWFEAVLDEDEAQPCFPKNLAEQVIVQGTRWDSGSAHLFQWLTLLDAKVSHLGGRHLLSEAALEVVRQSRPALTHTDVENEEDGDTELAHAIGSADTEHPTPKVATPPTKGVQGGRLSYLLSSGTSVSLPSNVIRMDIFNILLQPAFEFHMTSQAYSRRIGCHDRHHRNRGTPEDELEVMNACMGFEAELQELWRQRPGILNLDDTQLGNFVSEDIARRLGRLFGVYIATFWAHFIYIQRVAFWTLKHTPIALKALEQTGIMMRRSVGQPVDEHAFDKTLPRTPSNSIHPGLMWTCFLFGCEVADPVQQDWCVQQLRALGKLPSTGADRSGGEDDDELLAFRLDEKGAQNALKASQLLKQVIERQGKAGARIDGKYLSQELFGCHFYII